MGLPEGDLDRLRELEESLWRAETRFDLDHMERVLSPDFLEFGRSGSRRSRRETLAAPAHPIDATLPLPRFSARPIADDVVLVTYVSRIRHEGKLQVGNRSSLWTRTPDGWRLRFHQGTPTDVS